MMLSREWSKLPADTKNLIEAHQNRFPIKVGNIARDLGLVVKKSTLSAGISGEIKIDGECIIRVNRHDVKARQRFTVSHEIAHFLLHYDLIGDGITDDVMYRSSLSDALEAQANRLAADIVMPWKLMRDALERYSNKKIEEKIELIAEEAELSTTAIKIRLGKI